MIPKIIHYCWLSNDPFPESIKYCINSWKKILPDYELMLWNFDRFPKGKSKWVDEAFAAKKYAFAADYIRLYALYNFGGIYLDSDVEVLRPFDDLLNLPYFLGMEGTPSGIEAATLGFEKGNEMIGNLLKRYEGRSFYKEGGEIDKEPLPYIIRNEIDTNFKYCPIIDVSDFDYDSGVINVFPVDWFSPKSWDTKEITVTEKTYSIHHFEGSWLDKEEDEPFSFSDAKQPLISILVPVYNVEKYIDRSINSITRQTYKNLEIIIVDDGSTDRSREMCDRWGQIDKRITVIHQQNKGLLTARKKAVEAATGDFFVFVDSDDWIEKDTCEKCLKVMSKENVDIVCFGTIIEATKDTSVKQIKEYDTFFNRQVPKINSTSELLKAAFKDKSFPWNMWGKMYKSNIVKTAYSWMPEFRCNYAEDLLTSYLIYSISKTCSMIPNKLHHYRIGSGISTKNDVETEEFLTLLKAFDNFEVIKEIAFQKELSLKSSFDITSYIEESLNDTVVFYLTKVHDKDFFTDWIDNWTKKIGTKKAFLYLLRNNIKEYNLNNSTNKEQIQETNKDSSSIIDDLNKHRKKYKKHLKTIRILIVISSILLLANITTIAIACLL